MMMHLYTSDSGGVKSRGVELHSFLELWLV